MRIVSATPHINLSSTTGFASALDSSALVSSVPNVRYNHITSNFEVAIGTGYNQSTSWTPIQQDTHTLYFSSRLEEIINYVSNLMSEEARIKELAKNNKAIQVAVDNVEKAKHQLKTTVLLVTSGES